ncbi:MAG: hypothetical protein RLZZ573_1047 [Pseudomonadota bacterium]|jgi:hypothetical protein
MLRLYTEHVAQVDHVAMQRISSEFQRMMSGMAESAKRTGASAQVQVLLAGS